jgi:choline dehydrogenase
MSLQSTDPFTYPQIKVNYFSVDFDMQVQVAGSRLARKILTSGDLK